MNPIEVFMRESNWIEGERESETLGRLHRNDIYAARKFLGLPTTQEALKALHYELSEGRPILRGRHRTCDVRVGRQIMPSWKEVPVLMDVFFDSLPHLNSWEAHRRYEAIHPFEDLNGRTGRLLWLQKFIEEGNGTPQSFLQMFYYQTLSRCKC